VKVNVDASSATDLLRETTGVVIHDSTGKFVVTCNYKLDFAQDVLILKVRAFERGLDDLTYFSKFL
jgi:hypothetical protein